jgi:hypothetical protein
VKFPKYGIACIAVASASSTNCAAAYVFGGRLTCNKVHKMFPFDACSHTLCIGLGISWCHSDILDSDLLQKLLEFPTNKLPTIVMNTAIWWRITRQPTDLKLTSNVVRGFVVNAIKFNKARYWINACECIEFNLTSLKVNLSGPNKIKNQEHRLCPMEPMVLLEVAVHHSLHQAACWAGRHRSATTCTCTLNEGDDNQGRSKKVYKPCNRSTLGLFIERRLNNYSIKVLRLTYISYKSVARALRPQVYICQISTSCTCAQGCGICSVEVLRAKYSVHVHTRWCNLFRGGTYGNMHK